MANKDDEKDKNLEPVTPLEANDMSFTNRQNSFGGSLSEIFTEQREENKEEIDKVKVQKKIVKAPPVSSQGSMYGGLGAVMRELDKNEEEGKGDTDKFKLKSPTVVKNTSTAALGALGKAFIQNDKEREKDAANGIVEEDKMPDLKKQNDTLIVKHNTSMLGALGKAFDDQDLNNGKLTEENKQIKKEDHETEQMLGSLGSVFNNLNRKK